ncbi:hypothetical protein FNV43_RR10102 [Rhamnella rubrinervis]|uniref:Uncharacterized protein n=1 Tax=Rhamnella rubrinervis TaxID=2594499 RepID=A0A8K0MKF3_9ROSA|nr:hypothetical protein FNV43_RR10102 [Rhamnella rubrinervis]
MQRQSLGSPNSKLHSHGGAKEDSLIVEDDLKRKDLPASSSITTDYDYEDDEHKATKRHRLSSPPPIRAEKFIHFIPVLTLFCFLVLYLCSHSPTQSDLAHFNGFKWPAKRIDDPAENEIGDIDRFMELPKGDVLTIRSLRNLQGIKKHGPKSRNHRKLADF